MRAIYSVGLSVMMITGCGGSSARPVAEAEAPASQGAERGDSRETTPEAALGSDAPVSWTLFQPMRIDPDGVVTVGGRTLGTLSGGSLIGPDDSVIASVDADGYVSIEGRRTRTRISGLEVHEHSTGGRDELALRIDGDSLVVGDDEERMPIEHFQPARSVEVLLVSTFALHAMAAAFQH